MFILVSVYDRKTEEFMAVFQARTIGAAMRQFADALASEESNIVKHPEDFFLAQIGSFNEETGAVSSMGDGGYLALMEAAEAVPRRDEMIGEVQEAPLYPEPGKLTVEQRRQIDEFRKGAG